MIVFFCLVFLFSGAAALIFELVWFQLAGITFGNSVWASTVVLASFMGGLAAGNWLIAKYGDRLKKPVRFYALMELGISITGFALVLMLPKMSAVLGPLFSRFIDSPVLLNGVRLMLSFFLMIFPTTAMGATLPLLVKALSGIDKNFGKILGALYGWNTFGAVLGVVASEFLLIRIFGLAGTGAIAAVLNILAAVLALCAVNRFPASDPQTIHGLSLYKSMRSHKIFPELLISFICGFVLLGLEIIWFRFILLFFTATSWTFALMLSFVLLGISCGGMLSSFLFKYFSDANKMASYLMISSGILISVIYSNFGTIFTLTDSVNFLSRIAIISFFVMFPICLISGMIYTFLGKMMFSKIGEEVRATGILTLANTTGGMLGSAVCGVLLLPTFGVERSFFVFALLYGAGGIFLLFNENQSVNRRLVFERISAVAVFFITTVFFPFGFMKENYLDMTLPKPITAVEKRVAYKEGLTETIQYLERDLLEKPHYYRLVTNSLSMSGTNLRSRRYMKFFVYLPIALNPSSEDALLICYGCGSTAKALTDTKSLKRIDFVDISRDVFELSNVVYRDPRENPLNDERVTVHVEDGRFFLLTTNRQYDLITAEPPPPKNSGIVNLYTQEYFQLIYDRLKPNGMVTYWLPVYQLRPKEAKSIIKAFSNVFNSYSLWTGADLDWMLVGTKPPFEKVSASAFSRQWNSPSVRRELMALGFINPEQLGAQFISDGQKLANWIAGVQPLEDNYPQLLSPDTDRSFGLDPYTQFSNSEKRKFSFRSSTFINNQWPDKYKKAAEPYFTDITAINRMLSTKMPTVDLLNSVVHDYSMAPYALWAFRSDKTAQDIIDEAIKSNRLKRLLTGTQDILPVFRHFAARSFKAGDYLTAEKYLKLATDHLSPESHANNFYYSYRAYILYISGLKSEAKKVLNEFVSKGPNLKNDRQKYAASLWNYFSSIQDLNKNEIDTGN